MKFKLNKIVIISVILIISLVLNIFQFFRLKHYETQQQANANNNFNIAMQLICISIENLKTKEIDQTAAIAQLSSGTSKADAIYSLTSYYKENPLLNNTLWELNNNITNRKNIREVIEKNDLSALLPTLHKIIDRPTDKTATKNLDYLVKKYTVIGSTLP